MIWQLTLVVLISVIIARFTTPYMGIASLAYLLMLTGVSLRKQKIKHVRLMSLAIGIDLALVLILQIKRAAIQEAFTMPMSTLQHLHIAASSLATALYFPVMGIGYALFKNRGKFLGLRTAHLRLGLAAFICRTVGFLLMFSMLSVVKS